MAEITSTSISTPLKHDLSNGSLIISVLFFTASGDMGGDMVDEELLVNVIALFVNNDPIAFIPTTLPIPLNTLSAVLTFLCVAKSFTNPSTPLAATTKSISTEELDVIRVFFLLLLLLFVGSSSAAPPKVDVEVLVEVALFGDEAM